MADIPAFLQSQTLRRAEAAIDTDADRQGDLGLWAMPLPPGFGVARERAMKDRLYTNALALRDYARRYSDAYNQARYSETHLPDLYHANLNARPRNADELMQQTLDLYGRAIERGKVLTDIHPDTGFTDHLDKDGKPMFADNYLAIIGGGPPAVHDSRAALARYLRGESKPEQQLGAAPFKLPGPDNAPGVSADHYALGDNESVETLVGADDDSTLIPDPGEGVKLASDQNRIPVCPVWRVVVVRGASASNAKYRQQHQLQQQYPIPK